MMVCCRVSFYLCALKVSDDSEEIMNLKLLRSDILLLCSDLCPQSNIVFF
jgi:hypothetical protein